MDERTKEERMEWQTLRNRRTLGPNSALPATLPARPPVFLGAAATAVVLLVFSRGRRVHAGQRVE